MKKKTNAMYNLELTSIFLKRMYFFFYTLFIILNETHFVFQAIGTQQHHKSNPVLVVWIERLERNVSYIDYKNKK